MKNTFLKLVCFILLFSCCKSIRHSFITAKANKNDYYFPLNITGDKNMQNGKLDSFQNRWYSEHLNALKEPILYDKSIDGLEIYRYTNLGTWSNPITFRIEKHNSVVTITRKRTNGQGGFKTGRLIENVSKSLTISDWNSLQLKLQEIHFWDLQTHDDRGLDGEEWIVEGLKNGQYHFTTRWSPDSNGSKEYVELCNLFEKLFSKP